LDFLKDVMRHAEKKNARGKSSCGAHTRGKQAAGSVATKLANARLPDWIRGWEGGMGIGEVVCPFCDGIKRGGTCMMLVSILS